MTLPSSSPPSQKCGLVLETLQLIVEQLESVMHGRNLMFKIFDVQLHITGSPLTTRGQWALNNFGRHSYVQVCCHVMRQHVPFKYCCFPLSGEQAILVFQTPNSRKSTLFWRCRPNTSTDPLANHKNPPFGKFLCIQTTHKHG